MKTYKVWIEIEEFDDKTEVGKTIDAPGASVAVFRTNKKAYDFATRLQAIGEVLADEAPINRIQYP